MKTKLKQNVELFFKTSLFFLVLNSVLFVSAIGAAKAGERTGNGGDIGLVALNSEKYKIQDTIMKIINFFERTPQLSVIFPEINIQQLVELREELSTRNIEVTTERVFDTHGEEKTCINYYNQLNEPGITCNFTKLRAWVNVEDYFVLVLHEMLGLQSIEVDLVDEDFSGRNYYISGRIRNYVSRVSNFDLVYNDVSSSSGPCKVSFRPAVSFEEMLRLSSEIREAILARSDFEEAEETEADVTFFINIIGGSRGATMHLASDRWRRNEFLGVRLLITKPLSGEMQGDVEEIYALRDIDSTNTIFTNPYFEYDYIGQGHFGNRKRKRARADRRFRRQLQRGLGRMSRVNSDEIVSCSKIREVIALGDRAWIKI